MAESAPILEFDPNRRAVINSEQSVQRLDGIPSGCVISFFHDVLGDLVVRGETTQIATLTSELGVDPVFRVTRGEQQVALVQPGVAARRWPFL